MSEFEPTTPENAAEVLKAFAELISQYELDESQCELIDSLLDEFLSMDYFGTEGQLDPRGDHRD